MKSIKIPTGYLIVDEYGKGPLETLSIGDYGKAANVKANFLGYDRPLHGVPNGPCLPLSEKWVITLSTQYGCPMRCTFCDVPNIKFAGNASFDDLKAQLYAAIRLFPDVRYAERLNIHFARMGEPIFNTAVFALSEWLAGEGKRALQNDMGLRTEVIHPVLTTSLPKGLKNLGARIAEWCAIKNGLFRGQAGLQFSINSTDEAQRDAMFSGMQLPLDDFTKIADRLPDPLGRKYCLNFAYATGSIIDGGRLASLFDPKKFMVKITPIHNNGACRKNGIETIGGYDSYTPYADIEASLIAAGFDVLVFIPSIDEEDGLVTCGNAVLGGSSSRLISAYDQSAR